jgi:hypothetical protein
MSKAAELAKAGETLTNQPSGRKNLVTNGAMQVAQRSTSETGLGAEAGYFTLDRWRMAVGGTSAGRFTMAQVADGPSGFANCLKLDCTTADTSIAAGEALLLQTRFEGQDLQQLKKGTSDAESVTVSFYVKGNAAALYVCEIYDQDNNRSITQSFAVTTAWNRIELTFAADTSDPLDDDTANSFSLQIWLHAGATYTGGTFAVNTWNDVTNANRYAVASRTSIFDSTDREFFITGVQMEIGSQATNFEHRSFGEELALCQRYYYNYVSGNLKSVFAATAILANYIAGVITFPVTMRAAPTLDIVSGTNYYEEYSGGSAEFDDFTGERLDTNSATLSKNGGGPTIAVGDSAIVYTNNASASISFDADM